MIKSAHKKSRPKFKPHRGGRVNRMQLGIITLGLLFLLIILGRLFGFVASLSGPFAPIGITQKFYNWNGKGLLNIAVKGDKVYLLSYNPSTKAITLLKIPDETFLDTPYGFGSWPARSIFGLGQAEQPPMGGSLLKETIATTLGVGVDDYLILNDRLAGVPLADEVKKLKENPWEVFNLLSGSKTDLSLQELGSLVIALSGVRSDKINVVDLGDSNLTISRLLPDGTRVLAFDTLQLDEFMQTQLTDALIKDEELNVGIYNATAHPGLAEKAARLIGNMGGRVVFTTNSAVKLQENKVLGQSTYTKTRLFAVFAPQCLQSLPIYQKFFPKDDGCECKDCEIDTSRADINIFLGENFYQKQVQKDSF